MSFVESLALLAITTVLGSLLIPLITRRWQQQQKALDVKAELINDITQFTAEMMEEKSMVAALRVIELSAAAETPILEDYPGPEGDFVTRTNIWSKKRLMIGSRLKVYFPDPQIAESWHQLTTALLGYLWLDHHPIPEGRDGLIASIKECVGDKIENVDWDLVAVVRDDLKSLPLMGQHDSYTMLIGNALALEADALIELVLKSRVHGEFRLTDWLDW